MSNRTKRVVKLFCWMTEQELVACARAAKLDQVQEPLSAPMRMRILKQLDKKGWWRGDVTDLNNIRLQRRKDQRQ